MGTQLTFTPSDQQVAMRDLSMLMQTFKGLARAGTGKTATGQLVAEANPAATIIDLVFNKSAQLDGKDKMPTNCEVRTWHSLAYGRTIARGMFHRSRLKFSALALVTEIEHEKVMNAAREAYEDPIGRRAAFAVVATLTKWANSRDQVPAAKHTPPMIRGEVSKVVGDTAHEVWKMICQPTSKLPITHDFYLKAFQLQEPRLPYDMMILDEAQDQSPVMLDVVDRQVNGGMCVIAFGDSQQQIYAWRGAEDAMKHLPGKTLPLTQSWRFGPEIAEAANEVLKLLQEKFLVEGAAGPGKVVDDPFDPMVAQAVLCRGNAGVVYETLKKLELRIRVGVVGGTKEAVALLYACFDLFQGMTTNHPEIGLFKTWTELKEFSETDEGGGFRPIVKLVENHGYGIPSICQRLKNDTVDEDDAQVVVSTAHKAKGREWGAVQIADDFSPLTEEISEDRYKLKEEEANLQYVAITRAKRHLNMGGLRAQIAEDQVRMNEMRGKSDEGTEELL